MSYGLEIWNSLGQKTFAVNGRLAKLHSAITYSSVPANTTGWGVTIFVPGLINDGTWAVLAVEPQGVSVTIQSGQFYAECYGTTWSPNPWRFLVLRY